MTNVLGGQKINEFQKTIDRRTSVGNVERKDRQEEEQEAIEEGEGISTSTTKATVLYHNISLVIIYKP